MCQRSLLTVCVCGLPAAAFPRPPLGSPIPQDQTTIPALQEEIDFLKAQIQDYQKEIIRIKEAYEAEFSLHVLARAASAADKIKDTEYICTSCGEIYAQAGYRLVKEPIEEALEAENETKEFDDAENPVVTQEPTGSLEES